VLAGCEGRSTGKLHAELCGHGAVDRDAYEQLLAAMALAGLVELREESFRAEGKDVAFRKAILIREADDFRLLVKERPEKSPRGRKRAAKKSAPSRAATGDAALIEALKKWRMGVAKKEGVPAFRVLTDKALTGIAAAMPATEEELLQVSGVGPRAASRHGAAILRVLSAGGHVAS
jgi:superfamily II DNA helicase RecQ